jgi:hypothetical protein
MGSWTGEHIPHVLDLYVQVATEGGLLPTLYGYFGDQAGFDVRKDCSVKNGASTWISSAEADGLRAVTRRFPKPKT